MKHIVYFILSAFFLLTVATSSYAMPAGNIKSAREVIEMLNKGQFKEIISRFDSTMKKAAPEPRLRAIWTSLIGQTGKLQTEIGDTSFDFNGYNIVIVTCRFEKSKLDVKVVFDKDSEIAGLFFAPHVETANESGRSGASASDSLRGAPYISKDVTFENKKANVTLAGTLTIPNSTGTFPAVLLIAGSGPNGRNETVAGHKIFLTVADYLTRHGIAVLRYDKRGIDKSTGNYASATTKDFASDALAGVDYLMTVKQVDHKKIGLIGHSEGGEIAPIVADESPNVAFIVLMAGPGVPGYKIILSQVALIDKAAGVSDSAVHASLTLERKLLDIVMTEKDSAEASVTELLSPWYRDFFSYDPRPALRKVKCPVLALWGSKDLQVSPSENMSAVRAALRSGGNKHFKVMEIKGLNHLFQDAKTGSPFEYGTIKEAISPKALRIITNWILKETRTKLFRHTSVGIKPEH